MRHLVDTLDHAASYCRAAARSAVLAGDLVAAEDYSDAADRLARRWLLLWEATERFRFRSDPRPRRPYAVRPGVLAGLSQ